jgi:hypothetical protein
LSSLYQEGVRGSVGIHLFSLKTNKPAHFIKEQKQKPLNFTFLIKKLPQKSGKSMRKNKIFCLYSNGVINILVEKTIPK